MLLKDYMEHTYSKGPNMSMAEVLQKNVALAYPGPIRATAYAVADRQLVFCCKLPSRHKRNISFDVVIQLDLSKTEDSVKVGIGNYNFKVFSNSPSFYYTYAHAFQKQGLFCEWLSSKYDKKGFKKSPVVRNPSNSIEYERTIYDCMKFVSNLYRGRAASDIFKRAKAATFDELAMHIAEQHRIETDYENAPETDLARREHEAIQKRKEASKTYKPTSYRSVTSSSITPSVGTSTSTKKVKKSLLSSMVHKIKKVGH